MYPTNPLMRLLLALHGLSAVDEDRARSTLEVARAANMAEEEVLELVEEVEKRGYVKRSGDKVFLTPVGIIKILNLFS